MKFGKLREASADDQLHPSAQHLRREREKNEIFTENKLPPGSPDPEIFQETIVIWQPGERVEISFDPPNLWALLAVSGILGLIAGMFGSVIIGLLLFGDGGERAYYFIIFAVLSVLVGGYLFGTSRLKNRASRTIFDWDTNMLDAHREFAFSWQGSLHDIQSLIVRRVHNNGRTRRYRSAIELDVVGKHFLAARSALWRRRSAVAQTDALSLAEPLAAALDIPIQLEGWDDTTANP